MFDQLSLFEFCREDGNEKPVEGSNSKQRKRKAANANSEVTDSDFKIFQAVVDPKWPHHLEVGADMNALATFICNTSGMLAGVARYRRSSLKKAVEEPSAVQRLYFSFFFQGMCSQCGAGGTVIFSAGLMTQACPGLDPKAVKALPRFLMNELSTFGSEFTEKYDKGQAKERQLRIVDVPGVVLAAEQLVQKTCDEAQSSDLQFMNRDDIATKLLAQTFLNTEICI